VAGKGNKISGNLLALLLLRALWTLEQRTEEHTTQSGISCSSPFQPASLPVHFHESKQSLYSMMEGWSLGLSTLKPSVLGAGWALCESPWPGVCSPKGWWRQAAGYKQGAYFTKYIRNATQGQAPAGDRIQWVIPVIATGRHDVSVLLLRSSYHQFGRFNATISLCSDADHCVSITQELSSRHEENTTVQEELFIGTLLMPGEVTLVISPEHQTQLHLIDVVFHPSR
jgi:hypothetical protein